MTQPINHENGYIRTYTASDENELMLILKEKGGHYIYEEKLDLSGFQEAYVYVKSEKIVGFLVLEVHPKTSQIICYVSPSYRNKGIGTTLFEYGKERLSELDPNTIWLFFRSDIGSSAEFYQKRGGKPWYQYHLMVHPSKIMKDDKCSNGAECFDDMIPYNANYFNEYLEVRADAFLDLNKLIDARPYDERERKEDIRKWTEKHKESIWLFIKDGQVVGSIAIYEGFFDEIFVKKEVQQKGLGSEIVTRALSYCRSQNWSPMLCVVTGNQRAIHLYEKMGFEIVQTLEMNRMFSLNKAPDYSGPIGG